MDWKGSSALLDLCGVWEQHRDSLELLIFEGENDANRFASSADRADWLRAADAAIRGDLDRLQSRLCGHGATLAEHGATVEQCGALPRALQRALLPLVITTFAAQPARLTDAIQTLHDVTERGSETIRTAYLERREAEFHAREEDLATTLDSIGDGVIVTDADGCVTRMNPVAERLTGFAVADTRGRRLDDVFRIVSEETGQPVDNPVARVLREGVVVGLANHTVLVARDGTERPIADSAAPVRSKTGKVRGVVLVFRDVTEERQAEEKLKYWERVFHHANWGVALADVKEVKFRAVNPAYASMHGYTVEELLGAPVSTLWTEETRADMERHAHETHEHGHLVTETTHRCKDGSTLPVEVVAATIRDASGKVAWFVANVQDITERRRLQQSRVRAIELEARNRRIEEANRMKSEFLANMSHELRTPLNSVIGFAELLHDEQVGPIAPKQKEFLGDILTGGRHLLRLINDVLDLAKVEAGKMDFRPEPVDLERLVATVVHSLRAAAIEKQLEVVVSVDPALPNVEIDPARFKQILYNYLSNALKFAHDASQVMVRVTPEGDQNFRLEVEDRGIGIAPEQEAKLFVAFQQLESGAAKRHGGTGLGLALTRRLAEAQGGTVGVRPAQPHGSIFFAILPVRQAFRQDAVRPAARSSLAKVLVVEPNQHLRESVVVALLDAGYEVQAVGSIAQAMRAWSDRTHDAVLIEVEETTGDVRALIELARREQGVRSPAVIAIGVPGPGLEALFPEFLTKPVTSSELLVTLERLGAPSPRGRPVLVVDDDVSSLKLMEASLANLGYDAVCFSDPHSALLALPRLRPAAVIIDIIMPDMDGLAFVRRFRAEAEHRNVPVMFWTVKDLSSEERATLQSAGDLVVQKGVGDGSRLSAALAAFLPARGSVTEG